MAALMRALAGVMQVMRGDNGAYPACLDAFVELDALDGGWLAVWGGLFVGMAAELAGDPSVAMAQALRFLGFCRRSGVRILLTCGLSGAARLSALAGFPEQSLRLWGGVDHSESVTGLRHMPLMQRLDLPHRRQCTEALGPDATRLLAEGAAWSVAEVTQAAEEALNRLQAHFDRREGDGPLVAPLGDQ